MTTATLQQSRTARIALWTIQGILAALFVFAGGMKLVMPIAAMTQQTPLPGFVLRMLGVLELAGGLGLILPGLLHLRAVLTPLAAAGLILIMSGATAVTLATGHVASAAIPVIVGTLLLLVAYLRWQVLPHDRLTHLRPTHLIRHAYPTRA